MLSPCGLIFIHARGPWSLCIHGICGVTTLARVWLAMLLSRTNIMWMTLLREFLAVSCDSRYLHKVFVRSLFLFELCIPPRGMGIGRSFCLPGFHAQDVSDP